MAGNILVGILFLVVGVLGALNVAGVATKMASAYRRLPWWIGWSVTTTEWGVRFWSLLFVAGGVIFLAIGVRGGR